MTLLSSGNLTMLGGLARCIAALGIARKCQGSERSVYRCGGWHNQAGNNRPFRAAALGALLLDVKRIAKTAASHVLHIGKAARENVENCNRLDECFVNKLHNDTPAHTAKTPRPKGYIPMGKSANHNAQSLGIKSVSRTFAPIPTSEARAS